MNKLQTSQRVAFTFLNSDLQYFRSNQRKRLITLVLFEKFVVEIPTKFESLDSIILLPDLDPFLDFLQHHAHVVFTLPL